jgi:tetratricopeptide (TPR) repeat protein
LEAAKVFHERGNLADAEILYNQLLNKNFDDAAVLFYYGTLLLQQGKSGLASNVLRMALADTGDDSAVLQNLSNCYKTENKVKETEDILKLALAKKPNAEIYAALGNLHINDGTPHKALEYYEAGLKLDPTNDLIKFHIGLANLELGLYRKGWEGYERGLVAGNRVVRQYRNLPYWDGTPGKTVIVWGEQGVGDEIMFASCIPDAIKVCKKVILDCHPRLVDTFKRSFPEIEVHGTRKNQMLDWLPGTDAEAQCSITTLAAMWRNEKTDFPRKPYLTAASKEYKKDGRKRVGLAWTGGIKQTRKDLRSVTLDDLKPILAQDFDFYSLQYMPEAAREICEFEERSGVRVKHYPGLVECKNYDETINFIASLDLVISVCTTTIHAAGALGVPCWIMTPAKPAWRYGLKGENHDWYGSVKMFRQKPNETWAPVIHKVSEALKCL